MMGGGGAGGACAREIAIIETTAHAAPTTSKAREFLRIFIFSSVERQPDIDTHGIGDSLKTYSGGKGKTRMSASRGRLKGLVRPRHTGAVGTGPIGSPLPGSGPVLTLFAFCDARQGLQRGAKMPPLSELKADCAAASQLLRTVDPFCDRLDPKFAAARQYAAHDSVLARRLAQPVDQPAI